MIIQDADRLDALGTIGIARTFCVADQTGVLLFDLDDPLAKGRRRDDRAFGPDHFETKLFRTAENLQTKTAQKLARQRVDFMRSFVGQLATEIPSSQREFSPFACSQRASVHLERHYSFGSSDRHVSLAFGLMYFFRVSQEEAMMQDRFGQAYDDYCKRTGGLWPVAMKSWVWLVSSRIRCGRFGVYALEAA